jgi:hypothetical protein
MSAIDLPFLGQDAHLRRCAFSRYGEWKLALHHWHDVGFHNLGEGACLR